MKATYSPDDNKLRLYAETKLDPETYARVRAAGFVWAPKQHLFVAPAWSPDREDLLIELCEDIEDEDTSLLDRAEDRVERFEDYSDKRQAEANAASDRAVDILRVIGGQPILVGHHSERRHRRDIARVDNGFATARAKWRTAEYWTRRAAAALQAAKYKERRDVRARRIKKIEAERRKMDRGQKESEAFIKLWRKADLTRDDAIKIANYDTVRLPNGDPRGSSMWRSLQDGTITPLECAEMAIAAHGRLSVWRRRWIEHYDLRLTYERVLVADAGGIPADQVKPEEGGACRCWASPGFGEGWSYIVKVNRVTVTVTDTYGSGGPNFNRTIPFDTLSAVMSAADVKAARDQGRVREVGSGVGFFLEDAGTLPADNTE